MSTQVLTDYVISETAIIHSTDLAFASAALIVYDHVITFDQEVDLFWTGRRDATKFLYLSIRYLGLIQAFISVYLHFLVSKPIILLVGNAALITLGAALCQAVIALRVWYLFTRNRQIQIFAASLYIVCIGSTMVLTGSLFDQIFQEMLHPSFTKSPTILALVYAPGFVDHSVLFALKVYRYMTSDRFQRRSSLLEGFLKEGLIMYACATGTLLYTIIALSLTDLSQLDVYFTGLEGGLVVGATLVSVCHALLSIRSLSATLHVDPAWLLNHAELSRVQWTKGNSEGEIFVELDRSGATELPMTNISHTLAPDAVSSSGSNFDDLGTPTKSYNRL
ncbi:uncharacterized protein BJ212DRAFT_934088 [Suillus subaureus]|uniref:DUF6533 domain-containing protein n=1 Tax=Suillus subaureus TaxID=48587 RepID=A0A9P7EIH1_9AGAM|nr:uncharacterized protein BJ212DRAFT_934088 [Suillus subaureus]KAG1821983.1 hypothetical protein BJ212DRAFT_934088 [Suillus subaureus]